MNKIKTIILKEWAEVFKNKLVIFTVAFLPLIMTALPLIIIYTSRDTASLGSADTEMPAQFSSMCPTNLNPGECFQVFMVSQFMLLFMMIPLAIPVTIAAYSIVGEKTTRSLEPLLATPISTFELLIGKSAAAAIPAILATYGGFGIYAIGAWIILIDKSVFSALLDLRWLIAIFIVGPLLAFMSIYVSVIVSSRVNDPRVAEQISMVVVVPLLGLFFGQISGLFIINRTFITIAALILILVDITLGYLAVRLFQRETILTRWK